jgi:glycosyltransferase involved in cell wall biosynthesis
MYTPDCDMIWRFDACIGLSKTTERYFIPRKVPFLWMPGACTPSRARFSNYGSFPERNGVVRLGYFGALADHAGVEPLIESVLATHLPVSLEICGYGKLADAVRATAERDTRIKFHGLLTPAQCLSFGRACDVLVNPRPATHGNENNFSSKLFDYALAGRSILTSNLSGVEEVLGPDAFYFDPHDFNKNLRKNLATLARTHRSELDRRGTSVQQHVLSDFSWSRQGARLANFLTQVCNGLSPIEEPSEALAA